MRTLQWVIVAILVGLVIHLIISMGTEKQRWEDKARKAEEQANSKLDIEYRRGYEAGMRDVVKVLDGKNP